MFLNLIILIIGFVILIKGADVFVDGASSLAKNFKISKMVIGLTIVAFGTSAPEFAVSVKSIFSGNGDIVLGNVIGSNIINILLILGISSLVHPLIVKSNTVKKELPITMLMSVLLSVLLLDNLFIKGAKNLFTRQDGIILLLFFLIFIYYLISIMRKKTIEDEEDEKYGLFKSILFTFLGIVCIIIGSNLVIDSCTKIATILGVSEKMISLTIVAFGTSLPELVTSVIATKKGEYDIAIGNIVGSNIFNIGVVLGIPVTLFGGINATAFTIPDLSVMVGSAILLFLFSFRDRKISKIEGILMLIVFVAYYSYVIFL